MKLTEQLGWCFFKKCDPACAILKTWRLEMLRSGQGKNRNSPVKTFLNGRMSQRLSSAVWKLLYSYCLGEQPFVSPLLWQPTWSYPLKATAGFNMDEQWDEGKRAKVFHFLLEWFGLSAIFSSCSTSMPASTMWPQNTRASGQLNGSTLVLAVRKYRNFIFLLVFKHVAFRFVFSPYCTLLKSENQATTNHWLPHSNCQQVRSKWKLILLSH